MIVRKGEQKKSTKKRVASQIHNGSSFFLPDPPPLLPPLQKRREEEMGDWEPRTKNRDYIPCIKSALEEVREAPRGESETGKRVPLSIMPGRRPLKGGGGKRPSCSGRTKIASKRSAWRIRRKENLLQQKRNAQKEKCATSAFSFSYGLKVASFHSNIFSPFSSSFGVEALPLLTRELELAGYIVGNKFLRVDWNFSGSLLPNFLRRSEKSWVGIIFLPWFVENTHWKRYTE